MIRTLNIVIALLLAVPMTAGAQLLVVPPDSNYGVGIDRDGHAHPLPMPPGAGVSPGLQVFPAPFLDRDDRHREERKRRYRQEAEEDDARRQRYWDAQRHERPLWDQAERPSWER